MPTDTGKIFEDALSLPPEDRVALAHSLLESLDTSVDEDTEQLWRDELRKRAHQLDSGAVRAVEWAQVRSRLLDRVRG